MIKFDYKANLIDNHFLLIIKFDYALNLTI